MHDSKIGHVHSASLIWNHKYEFRPKFGNMKFNYHFIRAILKLQSSVSNNIMLMLSQASRFVEKRSQEHFHIS